MSTTHEPATETTKKPPARPRVGHLPVIRIEMRDVRRKLTADERVEEDDEMYRLKREILEAEESLKSYTKERKGAIQRLKTDRNLLIEIGKKGKFVPMECEVRVNTKTKRRLVVRVDTGEQVADERAEDKDIKLAEQPSLLPNSEPGIAGTVMQNVADQINAGALDTKTSKVTATVHKARR